MAPGPALAAARSPALDLGNGAPASVLAIAEGWRRFGPLPWRDTTRRPPNYLKETIIGIIAFIILGLIAGYIARALVPGADPGGIIITCIVGVVGALLGGFLAAALFDAHPLDEFFDISTWLTAIVGAIVLLIIYRLVTGRRTTATT